MNRRQLQRVIVILLLGLLASGCAGSAAPAATATSLPPADAPTVVPRADVHRCGHAGTADLNTCCDCNTQAAHQHANGGANRNRHADRDFEA